MWAQTAFVGHRLRASVSCRLSFERLEDRCLLTYTITDLGTFGGTLSYGNGLNNRGQAVGGASLPCNCTSHPFLWDYGVLGDLGTPDETGNNGAASINDLGQVVGVVSGHPFLWSRQAGTTKFDFFASVSYVNNHGEFVGELAGVSHAYVYTGGMAHDLGTLYGGVSAAVGINDAGIVVGQASGHAFSYTEDGGLEDLGTHDGNPGDSSTASAINNLGQIVGDSYITAAGTTHAALFVDGKVEDIGTLGGYSWANAINNLGQVVGQSAAADGIHAFFEDLATMQMVDLNNEIPPDTGWKLLNAGGINDAGQIVGSGALPGYNNVHAYLLTPEATLAVKVGPVLPRGSVDLPPGTSLGSDQVFTQLPGGLSPGQDQATATPQGLARSAADALDSGAIMCAADPMPAKALVDLRSQQLLPSALDLLFSEDV
jgi:probable HAF family extracellular repeat protein